MLFDVAALLTSVNLGSVAEAFAMPELVQHSTSISTSENVPASLAIDLPDAPPLPFVGPEPAESPQQVLQGNRLLQQLSMLSAATVPSYLASNPHAVESLLASPPAASDVSLWWTTMTPDLKSALREASPQLVGNLDGIPFSVRDMANRTLLTTTMADLQGVVVGDSGRTIIENARTQLKMLQSISDALQPTAASPTRTLMTLDVEGQGRAAIVLGDLRSADYVTYLVPGMFFTIENQMGDWADAATRLHDEQLEWLERLGDHSSSVATVAWIGYHTPNLTNVGGIQNAEEGRDSLAAAIKGLQSIRTSDEPYVSIIAHSYGSTAALMALTEYDFEVDALALVGSPGSPAKSATQLHVRGGNVFVGEAAWDPIPNSSYFGSDPGSASYGAHSMGVTGGTDPVTGLTLLGSSGHNEYFSPGTESMRNFALISIGRGDLVKP